MSGLVGVLPDQVGISSFSPRLDEHGNSLRGIQAFERLSRDMGMHLFAPSRGRLGGISAAEADGTVRFELEGTVGFTSASELLDLMEDVTTDVLLDCSRAHSFTDVGRRMTLEGLRRLRLDGHRVALADPHDTVPDPDLGDGSYPDQV